ncbi:hypothetical protein J056_003729 [Wallemia ichthyophaga EXF-994]|uniref:Uncharacterized protein n=1 Tax=Wallemia ichthyophaga (strain EXF-994 / CBS 113033) TaxID=1299270 RepID=R9AIM3_WALI9|nr:uncharacterized protein J056_003729 [Wallemia ichthyophaga EXF-994]EOR02053.1 hypothetical protein J056_003729 [Wallemia ichthyophaga EXF-994]TIB36850.1 hypothetical protein E3P84_00628 [Wallemia ichthyophaga]TIB43284.1 hypothetical protein E3P83_00800 [Wallemia ichthyophaga]TIB65496.1 hypothetical protein E3P78_00603 [Wallemia ichthyophaga]
MPASRMRVDPATGLSTAKRTWIPRLYCALKTQHSGIDFCCSGNCIVINRTQFIEYLKDIQPVNSKSGQTSDRWDAWQRSAANYSLKTESECTCNPNNPIRSFSDLFVYSHPDIRRGYLPHPSLIHKKVPKKQQQQQQQLQRGASTERKKRSYSEADTKTAFTRTHLPKSVSAVEHSRRKSTGVITQQQQQQQQQQQKQQQQDQQQHQFHPQYYGYPTPNYSQYSSPIEFEALLPAPQQQQFDDWLVSDLSMGIDGSLLNDYNLGGVVENSMENSNGIAHNSASNSLGLLPTNMQMPANMGMSSSIEMGPHSGSLTPLSDPVTPTMTPTMTPSSNYMASLSPTTTSPYKASDGTMQAANAMQQLLYDDGYVYPKSEPQFNYNVYY